MHAHQTPQIKLLMTLPGVDFTVAETILAALGDTARFETPDKAASYLALPMVNAQGRTGWTVPVNLNYNSQNWRQDSGTDWNLGEDVGYELQLFNRLQFLARCDADHASERLFMTYDSRGRPATDSLRRK